MEGTSKSIQTTLSRDSFWESVNILLTKPHVVNKRLWGSKTWFKYSCQPISSMWKLPTTCSQLKRKISGDNIEQHATWVLQQLNVVKLSSDTSDNDSKFEVLLTELLPKNYIDKQAYQLVCLQKDKSIITFYNVTPTSFEQNLCPSFTYTIHLDKSEIVLTSTHGEDYKPYLWLVNTLLPQLIKWGTELRNHKTKSTLCSESLALVSQFKYYERYNELKLKYGKEMVMIWPECTDASKFVYEDVAIAAYLLLLWEREGSSKKQTFVDLGCGNGLLVYILTREGHKGTGYDVRKRNIWDIYPPDILLEEKTITPSDTSIFPETAWIIGNHSDELTPWVPVIAAKSSYKCNFFLLPCCAYNFNGSKYQRKNSYKSQYNDYLDHIKQLCEECGFKVDIDRLKIPSTKRICLVSNGRIYQEDEYKQYISKIDKIIKKNSNNMTQDNVVEKDFKAREAIERVRNCTQIDKSVIDSIVGCISKYLLEGCSEAEPNWSIGRTAEINEIVQLIPKEQLHVLKSECGGIQTLLKNNHNIFQVQSGKVQMRYPKTINEVNNNPRKRKHKQTNLKVQQKPCWFYNNHPQSCPLSDTDCSFLHVKMDDKSK